MKIILEKYNKAAPLACRWLKKKGKKGLITN